MKHLAIVAAILALASVCWGDSIPPFVLINTSGTITGYDPARPFLTVSGSVVGGGTFTFSTFGEKWAPGKDYVTGTMAVYASNFTLVGRLKDIKFPDGPNIFECYFTGLYIDPSGIRHHVKNYFFVETLNFQARTATLGGMRLGLQTPEPESLYLFASGLAMVGAAWRRFRADLPRNTSARTPGECAEGAPLA